MKQAFQKNKCIESNRKFRIVFSNKEGNKRTDERDEDNESK